MAIRSVSTLAALLVAQGVSMSAVAEEFEQHGAHEHGHAEFTVAQSGKSLTLALESPAMNLVGFEHAARTEKQKAAVQAMLTQLRQGYQMITLDEAALCLLDSVDIRQTLLADASDEHKGHDDHDEHKGHDDHDEHKGHDDHDEHKGHDDHDEHKGHDDHDEHKGHDDHDEHKGHDDHDEHKGHDDHDEHKGHDDHDEHKGHDHDEASTHSDVDVTWQFTCMQPAQLKTVKLGLFNAFPLLEELDVQWTGPAGQGAKELSPQQNEFNF